MLNARRIVSILVRCVELVRWLARHTVAGVTRHALVTSAVLAFILTLSLLLRWGLVCVNFQTWRHVNKVCKDHLTGRALGSLCIPLCVNEDIESLACQSFHLSKEAIFSGTWKGSKVIFKAPRQYSSVEYESLFWVDNKYNTHYPTENEFTAMIKDVILQKFNMTVTNKYAQSVGVLKTGTDKVVADGIGESDRRIEMSNVWFLLQQEEYMACILYEKYDIFPKLLGTCGPFYAVEHLKPLAVEPRAFGLDDGKEQWERRIHYAILILDYIQEIEKKVSEPLHICDVNMDHFGLDDNGRVKYLDLDSVHPVSVAGKLTGDGSPCRKDSDCDLIDCRSFCNKVLRKCDRPVANNNLQIICEKIFLGWTASGRVLVPGLLLGPQTPRFLADILQHCANPLREEGMARAPASPQMRNQLYNTLIKMRV